MVTFFNLNFLLYFILFSHYLIFFNPNTRFFILLLLLFFFFFSLFLSSRHVLLLSHPPQPHLLTFNHFLSFIVLSFCYFFSSSPSPFFNCALFISLSKTQASVPLNPTKATPLGPPPCLYQPLVHVFFWFKGKNCRRKHFGRR